MTERERELIATIWFLALMAVILLVLVSINAGGSQIRATHSWVWR